MHGNADVWRPIKHFCKPYELVKFMSSAFAGDPHLKSFIHGQ